MSKQCEIYKQMKRMNMWFHFTRNNPRNRDYFYNRLINDVGIENWKKTDDGFRNAWDKGKDSFDELYALIKAWSLKGQKSAAEYLKKEGLSAERDALLEERKKKEKEKAGQIEEFNKQKILIEQHIKMLSLELEEKELLQEIKGLDN